MLQSLSGLSAPNYDSSVPALLKALSRSSAASYRCSLVAKNLLRRRDRLEPARSQLRVRPSKYVFSSKIITRTSPRELWDRSDSFSRAHLAPNERPSQVLLQPLRRQFRHPRQIYRKIDWCRSFSQPLGCYHSNLEPRQWTAPPKS